MADKYNLTIEEIVENLVEPVIVNGEILTRSGLKKYKEKVKKDTEDCVKNG